MRKQMRARTSKACNVASSAPLSPQKNRMHTSSAPKARTLCMARALIYTTAWRTTASARTMGTMCKTFAAQRRIRVRKHACGNAREPLNACAQERSKLYGYAYELCAHIAFKQALDHKRIDTYACRPDAHIASVKRIPRDDNAEFMHGRALQCGRDAHRSYKRTSRHRCGPRNLPPSKRHANLAREGGRALAHHIF